MRENLVGTGFLDPPSILEQGRTDFRVNRVTAIGEIVSASGFNAENLYIIYETLLTEGWTFED